MEIRKHPIFSGILIILSLIVILGLADSLLGVFLHKKPLVERYIRLRELYPNSDYRQAVCPGALRYSDSLKNGVFRVQTDENGFIKPAMRHGKADLTMVFLGGSTTECSYVDEENRFAYLSGKILEDRWGIKVNSVNSGVSANHTMHMNDILLNKVVPLNPNIVVLHENINDVVTLIVDGSYWNNSERRSLIVEGPRFNLMNALKYMRYSLFRNLCDVIFAWGPLEKLVEHFRFNNFEELDYLKTKKIVVDEERLVREYRKSLELFVAICRIRGFTPVLMTQASRITDHPDPVVREYVGILTKKYGVEYGEFKKAFDRFNDCIRQVGAANGVLVIDMDKRIPKERTYLYDLVHYNDNGSRLAATVIADAIESTKDEGSPRVSVIRASRGI